MSLSHDPSKPDGKPATAPAPQVIVRAGKYFVCSACGVMVEVPADVVGEWVVVVDQTPQEEATPNAADPQATSTPQSPIVVPPAVKRPKRKHCQPTKPACLTGQTIDGLHVPSGKQLNGAMAWVGFHLKVLDRQKREFHRLRKRQKKRRAQPVFVSQSPPRERDATARPPTGLAHNPTHPANDASGQDTPPSQERGPP